MVAKTVNVKKADKNLTKEQKQQIVDHVNAVHEILDKANAKDGIELTVNSSDIKFVNS